MKNISNYCLSLLMVFTLVYSPVAVQSARATDTSDDFHNTCDKPLQDVENKKSTQGDQVMGYCEQADLAKQAKDVETAKSVIYGLGFVVCTAEAIIENTAGNVPILVALKAQAQAVCMATGIATSAAGIVADIAGNVIINKSREKYGMAKDQVCSVATFAPLITSLAPLLNVAGSAGSAASSSGGKSGCIACALTLGITTGVSISQAVAAKDSQKQFVANAKNVKDAMLDTVTNLNPQVNLNQQTNNNQANNDHHASNTDHHDNAPCKTKSGNEVLKCYGQMSPEIAALSKMPGFLDQMKKSLHGKSLGDFVKEYDPNKSSLSDHIANGLGVGKEFASAALKNSQKMAKDSGFMDNYSPMKYARNSGSAAKASSDLDFSKIMAGMMGKLDPNADQAAKDPSELVFRQLDLLPADKIQQNKDISLFARVAFRYRKNNSNLEQFNSVVSESQQKK